MALPRELDKTPNFVAAKKSRKRAFCKAKKAFFGQPLIDSHAVNYTKLRFCSFSCGAALGGKTSAKALPRGALAASDPRSETRLWQSHPRKASEHTRSRRGGKRASECAAMWRAASPKGGKMSLGGIYLINATVFRHFWRVGGKNAASERERARRGMLWKRV